MQASDENVHPERDFQTDQVENGARNDKSLSSGGYSSGEIFLRFSKSIVCVMESSDTGKRLEGLRSSLRYEDGAFERRNGGSKWKDLHERVEGQL